MGSTGEHEGRNPLASVGNVLFGADDLVGQWVAARISGFIPSDDARALGIMKNGEMAAGVIFERWNGVHVEASIAAEPGSGWADRRTLHIIFFYPFVTLGCDAISLTISSANLPSLNLATKLGFEPEAIVRLAAHDGSDMIILKMWRDKCRWIRHGQDKRCAVRT